MGAWAWVALGRANQALVERGTQTFMRLQPAPGTRRLHSTTALHRSSLLFGTMIIRRRGTADSIVIVSSCLYAHTSL